MKIEDLVALFPNSKDDIVIICNIEDAKNIVNEAKKSFTQENLGQFNNKQSSGINCLSITYEGKSIVFVDEKDAGKFCSLVSKK